VVLYFSVMDWHNPDWRYDIKTKDDSVAFERFKTFTRNQLIELLTKYPTAKGLWFDGTWDQSWAKQGAWADELEQELRRIHPGLIIGSRFHADEYGKRHFDSNGNLIGDYEQGWERKIPNNMADVHGNDWECVMTVPENMWGYNKKWRGHIKTADELIEMLARCVSLDGNFVLNFGPKPDGMLRQEEINLAKEIGDWMKLNGSAIYSCGYAGFDKQDWGYFTKSRVNPDRVNMLVFNVPVSGALRVKIPAGKAIKKAYLLAAPDSVLPPEQIVGNEYFIHLKKAEYQKPFTIILELTNNTNNGHVEKAKT
jgi:alpha-L-fucosidase